MPRINLVHCPFFWYVSGEAQYGAQACHRSILVVTTVFMICVLQRLQSLLKPPRAALSAIIALLITIGIKIFGLGSTGCRAELGHRPIIFFKELPFKPGQLPQSGIMPTN
ncbi:MAG: hypothetical protein H7X76_05890 [Prolixibacteraceae bacterium]|nr:hypothetical protein [Burkholderiales bacterium]